MKLTDQAALAQRFRDSNLAGRLLLPNAWDAVSARIFEQAEFPAVGTTSGGIAFSRGLPDAQQISREAMVREIASIAAAVECPVSADIEAGYGPNVSDVVQTVEDVLSVGVVGVNLEDHSGASGPDPLFAIQDQVERISAARETAERRGVPIVINARTDTFLSNLGADLEQRIDMTIARGRAYLKAGADLVFIPLALDPAVIRRLANGIGGPISVMAVPGAPSAAELFEAGAKRVSLGAAAMLATVGVMREIANEVRDFGTWKSIERHFYPFSEINALMRPKPAK
jgi:2-methylisocitrate lyase-like PEP mutase family enzyme